MGENLVAGILQRIENLISVDYNVNVQILTSIKQTNTILSKEIGSELQKQTTILDNILSVLKDSGGKSINVKMGSGVSNIMDSMLKVTAPFQLSLLSKSLNVLTPSIEKFVEEVNKIDPYRVEAFEKMIDLGQKIHVFAKSVVLAAPLLLIASVTTLPLLRAWILFFESVAFKTTSITKGAFLLLTISASTLLVVASLVAAAFIAGNPLNLMISIGIVVGVLFLMVMTYKWISENAKELKDGAMNMLWIGLTTALIVGIILITSRLMGDTKNLWEAFFLVSASLLVIGGVYYLLGFMKGKIQDGAKNMLWIALTTAIIVGIILITSRLMGDTKKLWEAFFLVSGSLLVIGLTFVLLGFAKSQIMQGALAMLLVSVVIGIIVYSLIQFKKAKIGWEDIGILSSFIVGMGVAFGVAGLAAPVIALGGGAMLIVAGAIWVMVDSLEKYQKIGWTNENTNELKTSITGVVNTFKEVFKDISLSEIKDLMVGATLLGKLGTSLTFFAQGISSFANLELSSYIYDSEDNIIGTKKEGNIDPAIVAESIKVMIKAVSEPLKKFGEANGESGIFRDGPVKTGIMLLGQLGNSLTNFAKGISSFANMEFVEYEKKVVDGVETYIPKEGTKGKIDPVGIGKGIDAMVKAVTGPLEKLGSKDGFLFDSDFEDGLDMIAKIGDPIFKISQTAKELSNLDIDEKKVTKTVSSTLGAFIGVFSSEKFEKFDEDKAEDTIELFGDFTNSLSKIKSDTIEKTGSVFVKMKDSVNGMNLTKLKALNDLAYNLSKFAENMDGSFSDLEKVLERLVDVVAKMNGIKVNTPTATGTTTTEENTIDLTPLIEELEDIRNVLLNGIEVTNKDSLLSQ